MESQKIIYNKIICTSAGRDLEDILDFANMVFSMSDGSIDFAAYYPKAYSEKRCGLVTHHCMKEDGKIRALLDSYPLIMRLGGGQNSRVMELKAVYIGTVSVHPDRRGRGYLTELMKYAWEDALAQGCAVMILDGNRHRYRPYGFERGGIRYSFHMAVRNLRHCCEELYDREAMEKPAYRFEEIEEDSVYLADMYALYSRRNVTAREPEEFLLCLQSGYAVTYGVLKEDKFAGYIMVSEDEQTVLEFEINDNAELPRMIYDLMMGIDREQIGICVGMDETGKIEYLEKMCNNCSISMSHHIKILDYEAALTFLFHWKRRYSTLAAADYVIGVRNETDGSIKKYQISVREEEVIVTQTENNADTILGELEFVSVLTTVFGLTELQKGSRSKLKNAPPGWFPLPFYLPDADAF